MFRYLALAFAIAAAVVFVYLAGIVFDWYGELEDSGRITASATSPQTRIPGSRQAVRQDPPPSRILFGDLHVHTTYSSDAFRMSLPMVQGDGAHPPADACDFARVCAALDFWALTDHAESLTAERWRSSIESVRQCNAVSASPEPDLVTFIGFEWTQAGSTPETHYGHKNVIFKSTNPADLPERPISSPFRAAFGTIPLNLKLLPPLRDLPNRQRYYDFNHFIQSIGRQPICPQQGNTRSLPADCAEIAATPRVLFRKLDEWSANSIVIPHGTTWGIYSPAGTSWDKQLTGRMHDPQRQTLLEVYSGHGNSEVFRDWKAVEIEADGSMDCPPPRPDYLPSCWRAGELIRARCAAAGLAIAECDRRAREARQRYLDNGQLGWHTVPGTMLGDWLDAGQCRDCFLPAFNYRPGGSAQYILAVGNFDTPGKPARFRFGFIASSDNHTARPGSGYKQTLRTPMTDWWGYRDAASRELYSTDRGKPEPYSVAVNASKIDLFNILELERQASFFSTAGLVAVHSRGRNREAIWQALKHRQVYGTSGPRILLWFDLLNPPTKDSPQALPMGSEAEMNKPPRFHVRALGAFKQKPGCPQNSLNALSAERLERLCRGECYNPSDERQAISRIEVIRIRPQVYNHEPVATLIEDPWKSFACDSSDKDGCEIEFSDPQFPTKGRDTVYYVRALQAAEPTINAGGLRCEYNAAGQCQRVNACYGDDRTAMDDNCLAPAEQRAWSSPIFVDYLPEGEARN